MGGRRMKTCYKLESKGIFGDVFGGGGASDG